MQEPHIFRCAVFALNPLIVNGMFQAVNGRMLETVKDRAKVTIDQWEITYEVCPCN